MCIIHRNSFFSAFYTQLWGVYYTQVCAIHDTLIYKLRERNSSWNSRFDRSFLFVRLDLVGTVLWSVSKWWFAQEKEIKCIWTYSSFSSISSSFLKMWAEIFSQALFKIFSIWLLSSFSSTMSLHRLSRALLTWKEGFSVVAPMSTIVPSSMWGSNASYKIWLSPEISFNASTFCTNTW